MALPKDNLDTVRQMHQAFLKEYGIPAWETPLLLYHPERASSAVHDDDDGAVFEVDASSVAPPPPPVYTYQRG